MDRQTNPIANILSASNETIVKLNKNILIILKRKYSSKNAKNPKIAHTLIAIYGLKLCAHIE